MPEAGPLIYAVMGSASDVTLTVPAPAIHAAFVNQVEVVSLFCPHCNAPLVVPWNAVRKVGGAPMPIHCTMCARPIRFEYGGPL